MASTPPTAGPDGPPGQQAPPYRPTSQALGQTPAIVPDIPVNAIFLLLFILGGAGHMFLLKWNGRHGRKFGINGACFGFCVTRVLATSLRIAWACHERNVRVGMAAMIFVYAGVILLLISNLFFAQRVIRAQHPHFGWTLPFSVILPILMFIVIATIIALIAGVILEFYSLSDSVHLAVRDIQIYGSTMYAVIAFIPIPAVAISSLVRLKVKKTQSVDKFGAGSMRAKIAIIIFSAVLLCLGASYRAGTTWLPPVPIGSDGPWYFSRGSFYAFNFGIELFIILFWLAVRIDKRFIIPDGAKGPFSYGGGFVFAGEAGNEKPNLGNRDSMRHLTGSQTSGFNSSRASRVSWGGSRNSMAHESRVSWGGISREDIHQGLGEDGIQIMPYRGDEEQAAHPTAADVGIDGVEAEMGWDPKSGKWALRPISGMTAASPAATRPHSTTENV